MDSSPITYVVSGYMRSGTSMMMRSLIEGGLDAEYNPDRQEMPKIFSDALYNPNEGGLFELASPAYKTLDFPRAHTGKLIKALDTSVPRMRVMPGGLRVVFMRRDTEEIRQSYLAFFGKTPQGLTEQLDQRMKMTIEQILNRKDVLSCNVFWYRDVVRDPLAAFNTLKESGWPIDVAKAAAVVDPNQCRYKIEELTVGVL